MFRFPIFCGEVFTYPHAFGDCETAGLRDRETAGPQDNETARLPHPEVLPLTLRVSLRVPTPNTPLLSLCGSSSAHCPPKNTLATLSLCGSSSRFAGRFLPTHTLSEAAGPRNYETTGPRDHETAAPRSAPPHVAGHLPHTAPPKAPRSPHIAGHLHVSRVSSCAPPKTHLATPPHIAGHLPRTAPQKLPRPPTLRVIFRASSPKNTLAAPSHCGSSSRFWGIIFQRINFKQQFITQHITRINQLSPINRQLISNNVLYSADVPFPNILRGGFYLPTRFRGLRDCGTAGRRDHGTTRQPRPEALPLTLRVSSCTPPKKRFTPPSLCGSSPTLRVLKIVPSQINRRSDTLKNSRKADPITIVIIVNSPILRIFRRLLLFSNE